MVVRLSLLSGRALAAQARGVLGLTPGGCQPFHFPLFSPHNINLFIHHNIFIPSLHLVPLCTPQNSLSYSYALNEQGTQHCNSTLHSLPHKMYLPCSNTKHICVSRQNGTRCRDGMKVLCYHFQLVWLVF